ncbi:hypothetical protein C7B77_02025 [Chamaesiphon polymorphus CCALA 037]|uniref:DUF559 domain-containing protein n=1 Tax=Chamaesiphon polymorphus CCALA 037 TaxID=2107692 RepID=A0A2T1GMM9_9CYAN|nr:hypothetical protein C7B77_02025 [Chamaesiphon polymorphus CCALA 037]
MLLFDFAISIPLSLLIAHVITIPVMGVLSFLLAGIGLYVGYKVMSYPRRKREHSNQIKQIEESNDREQKRYDDDISNYPTRERQYKQARQEHDRRITEILKPENVRQFQLNLIEREIQNTRPHDLEDSKAQRGFCEPMFGRSLLSYFSSSKIKTGLGLNISDYPYPYSPDFAYIDLVSGLRIDIEIDEPYAFNSREPTHYRGMWRDNNRNDAFLSRGWIVIRFAEEQVAKQPDECCKVIAKVVYEWANDPTFINRTERFGELQPIHHWSEEEAKEMAINDYRSKYSSVCENDFRRNR